MEVGRTWPLFVALVTVGCGASEPAHEVKPLTARPSIPNDFRSLQTPEEKIRFVQESKAPDAEKQRAIEQIRAGKL